MVHVEGVQRQGNGLHGVLNPVTGELVLPDGEHLPAILLPLYSSKASGQFGAGGFVVMWAGHITNSMLV